MSTAEVMTFAVMAVLHYRGDYCLTRSVARTGRYFTKMLGHSRLVRRIHQIPEPLWLLVIQVLRLYLRKPHERYFIVDSFPGKTYENHKSFRSRLFPGKEYHGYTQ